ncbi:unnamed protein product, partial [Prorocentrum cordatum]
VEAFRVGESLADALRLERGPGGSSSGLRGADGAGAPDGARPPESHFGGDGHQKSTEDERRKEDSIHRWWGARWLHQGDVGARLMVIRVVLRPLVQMMSSYLGQAGIKHDCEMEYRKLQAAAGSGPDATNKLFPMVAACRRVFEGEFRQYLKGAILTPSPWVTIVPGLRTHALRTTAFLMLSDIGCLCHEMSVLHTMYPFKMFRLLDGDSAADIESDCEDMKDGWSKELIEKYAKTEQGLLHPDLIAELTHVAANVQRETCSIESSHASIRRSLAALSVQTHPMHIRRLSALRTCQRFRTRVHRLRSGPGRCAMKGMGAAQVDRKPPVKKRFLGFGGAWRAFVRQQSLGKKGSPDFAELAKAYAVLSAAEKNQLRQMGKAATRAARAGNKTPFGGSSRSLEARARKAALARQVNELHERKLAALLGSSGGVQGDIAVATYDGIISIASSNPKHLADMTELRQLERAERAWRQSDQIVMHDAVSKWCSETGVEARAACLFHESAISNRLDEFLPIVPPCQGFQLFEWEPVGVLDRVKSALSVHRRFIADTFAALAKFWDDFHGTIDHHPRPEWDENDCADIPACMRAGMCVCTGAGLEVGQFVEKFDAAVKKACPVGRIRTEHLAHGYIVAYVFAQRQPADDEKEINIATDGIVEGLPIVDGKWLHIGHHNLSPWRSCFQLLNGPTGPMHPNIEMTNCHLEGTAEFATPWQAFKDFNRNLRWAVCVYSVDMKKSPLGTFVPDCIDVHLTEAIEKEGVPTCRVIWKPRWAMWRRKPNKVDKMDVHIKSGWHGLASIKDGELGSDKDEGSDNDDGDVVDAHGEPVLAKVVEAGVEPAAAHFIEVEGGRIVYNAKKLDLIAECRDASHVKCRKHRTIKHGPRPQQGRPIGYLVAWLRKHAEYGSQLTHGSCNWISKEDRVAARAAFAGMGPRAQALLAIERPRRPGEAAEPDVCP